MSSSNDQNSQPPIDVLRPAPDEVERAWQSRRGLSGLGSSCDAMTQCEMESYLGRMVDSLLAIRASAEVAEMKALRLRWDEAEAVEVISECRRRLSLPDGAIRSSEVRNASALGDPVQGREAVAGSYSTNSEVLRGA